MNSYVQKIIDNVSNINDIDSINEFIENLNISNNSKRMYSYWIAKHLKELNIDIQKLRKFHQTIKTSKNYLDYDEVVKIQSLELNIESKFIFNALLSSGMRVQEFVSVDWFNLNSPDFYIKTIKNKNEHRPVNISQLSFELLETLKLQNYDFKRLTIKRIQYLLSLISKKINLSTKLSPHVLRRTKGSLLRLNGAALEDIADILGHKKLDTTRIYYSKTNAMYLKSISQLSELNPTEAIDIQKLRSENNLLKREIVLLKQEIENLKNQK